MQIDSIEHGEIQEEGGFVTHFIQALDSTGASMGYVKARISNVDKTVTVTEFKVEKEGQGLGSKLLQTLAKLLGQGTPINSAVDHEESDLLIEKDGWYKKAINDPYVTIGDPEYLRKLSIVRIYERGGFHVDRIAFCSSEDNEVFAILYATTQLYSQKL